VLKNGVQGKPVEKVPKNVTYILTARDAWAARLKRANSDISCEFSLFVKNIITF